MGRGGGALDRRKTRRPLTPLESMTDPYQTLEAARKQFEDARNMASSNALQLAMAQLQSVVRTLGPLWKREINPEEVRTGAARLAVDASWSAGLIEFQGALSSENPTLKSTVLLGVEVYESTGLLPDVRLHGLYRAQCASFEMAHARRAAAPEDAIELFRDTIQCAPAAMEMDGLDVDVEKVARVQANGAAAALSLAQIIRDEGSLHYRTDLDKAIELGQISLELGALPPGMDVETSLVVAEGYYEVALLSEDEEVVTESLQSALAWTRQASEAPGANGALKAECFHRGANYACVYGLFRRHKDMQEGVDALRGAVELALAAADLDHIPSEIRAPSYETAVRSLQNIGIILKESGKTGEASEAFAESAKLCQRVSKIDALSGPFQTGFLYLGANAFLERAAIAQKELGPRNSEVGELLNGALHLATACLGRQDTPAEFVARSALLACSVAGRRMHTLTPGDEAGLRKCLTDIEKFGQRAAHAEGADKESRSKGAFFAADALTKLAPRLQNPRAKEEALQRASVLKTLANQLQ